MINHVRSGSMKAAGVFVTDSLKRMKEEIGRIEDPKHRVEMIEEYDKAKHWASKWWHSMEDIDTWLNAFGPELLDPADGDD